MEVPTRARCRRRSLVAAVAAAVALVVAPTGAASHFFDVCAANLSPFDNLCHFKVQNAHAGRIQIDLGTAGPPPYTGFLEVTVADAQPPDETLLCGPYLAGVPVLALVGDECDPPGFDFVPGEVTIDIRSRSLALVGPGVGEWRAVVRN